MKILIADDESTIRKVLAKTLAKEDYEILTAADGEEAWKIYDQERPELIITDWLMPGIDGVELCKRIRGVNREGLQPFILMLTSRDSNKDLEVGFNEAEADDFLSKPWHRVELQARVRVGARTMEMAQKLERMALTDTLTGLYNRRALGDLLRIDEDRAMRAQMPLGICLVDVDHFKLVNDDYGHHVGDQVLRMVAETLKGCVRAGDHVGRWGGEEFLMILPKADIIQAAEVAERCRATLAEQRVRTDDGHVVGVTASFGVASADGASRPEVMDLVDQSDKALYWAKDSGRNRVKIYVESADPDLQRRAS